MYYDNSSRSRREEWLYDYTGAMLLPFAKKKFSSFYVAEEEARKKMTTLLADMKISADSKEITDVKNEIALMGKNREACAV